jgi:MFS transporter, ACS family, hexuronate transporter
MAASIWVRTTTINAPVISGPSKSNDTLTIPRFTIAKFRWIIAGMLLIATAINYTDRVTLSVLIGDIQRELGLNDVDYSQILSVFLVSYAVMYAVSGYLVDRLGTRHAYAVFAFSWSVSQILHVFAEGKLSLMGCRVLLGLSETGNFPAATKAVSEWFPAEQRALGVGIFNAGSSLGAALAAPLGAWLGIHYGWRSAFLFTGALGLVWLLFWLLLYQPPFGNRWIVSRDRAAAQPPADLPEQAIAPNPWPTLLRNRSCLTLMLVRFMSDPVIYFVIFWLPAYLEKERGFDLASIGRYAWMPFVFGDIGYIAGGWFSGWLLKRGWTLSSARKATMAAGACLLPVAICVPFVQAPGTAIAAMCIVTLGHAIWVANLLTLPADLFEAPFVGTAAGLSGMGGSFGGLLANLAIGYVVSHFSYMPLFVLAGVLHPTAMLLILWLIPASAFAWQNQPVHTAAPNV